MQNDLLVEKGSQESDRQIGLALSGGGFRATLYHLGVIRYLYDSGLLADVSHICSVSGGSIIAAHLVLNWERYTGSREEFEAAANELVEFTQQDLRGSIVRPWLFSFLALGVPRLVSRGRWTRTALFEQRYASLYGERVLRDLEGTDRPELHLLATSLTTGDLVSIGARGFVIQNEETSTNVESASLPIAFGVAASSAFPPMFAPVPATSRRFRQHGQAELECDHYLTDGGVFDNLGIRQLLWLNREENTRFDLVIASRAERDSPDDLNNPFSFVWERAGRSTDLMMERISRLERASVQQLGHEADCKVMLCHLTETIDASDKGALPLDAQSRVQKIRTDLDEFSDDEVNGLIQHGYSVAQRSALSISVNEKEPSRHPESWLPRPRNGSWQLSSSHKRKVGLFRVKDWTSWASLTLCLIYILAPVCGMAWLQYKRGQAEAAVEAQRLAIEKQRQREARQTEIVEGAAKLVSGLAAVALSEHREQFSISRLGWQEDVELMRQNPFFERTLAPDEQPMVAVVAQLKAIASDASVSSDDMRKILDKHNFDQTAYRFSRSVRRGLLALEEKEPGYRELLNEKRIAWYAQDRLAATRIVEWATVTKEDGGHKPRDVKASRDQFWSLYWGVLGLVEGTRVLDGMVEFGKILRRWEVSEMPATPETKQALKTQLNFLIDALDAEENTDIQ